MIKKFNDYLSENAGNEEFLKKYHNEWVKKFPELKMFKLEAGDINHNIIWQYSLNKENYNGYAIDISLEIKKSKSWSIEFELNKTSNESISSNQEKHFSQSGLNYNSLKIQLTKLFTFIKESDNILEETIDMYHGCSKLSAKNLTESGWTPRSKNSYGSNMGRGDLLYLSSYEEDALWFAEEKGESSVVLVKNIPISYLIFDPEDGDPDLYDYKIENAISKMKKGYGPVKLALTKPLSKDNFKIVR